MKLKGYQILEAGDGEEALTVFEENKNEINLILLDVMMPKLDGWSVLRQIRQTSNVPIIMLTARGEEQDELFGFELGVDEYISKPFSPKILVARVEAILKRLQVKEKDIKDYDDIIFYYAGHAFQIKDENYLAGIDLLNVTSLPDEREKIFLLKRASLLLSEVLDNFKEDKQKKLHIVILDACSI